MEQLELNLNFSRSAKVSRKARYLNDTDRLFQDMLALIEKKNNDYSGGKGVDDPFANFRGASDFGVDPLVGLAIRMGDKFKRIQAFCRDGKLDVTNEGAVDAFKDLIGYSAIGIGMLKEREQIGQAVELSDEA
jgi:hypothetical protein